MEGKKRGGRGDKRGGRRRAEWRKGRKRKMRKERELEFGNFNKDSSVRSIWTYLTASPYYTTNINKHDYTTNGYYKHE